jgi:rRNA maturation endonuclease Nob1
MRPSEPEEGNEMYECFECGARIEQAEGRTCGSCGGALQNVGRARDL